MVFFLRAVVFFFFAAVFFLRAVVFFLRAAVFFFRAVVFFFLAVAFFFLAVDFFFAAASMIPSSIVSLALSCSLGSWADARDGSFVGSHEDSAHGGAIGVPLGSAGGIIRSV